MIRAVRTPLLAALCAAGIVGCGTSSTPSANVHQTSTAASTPTPASTTSPAITDTAPATTTATPGATTPSRTSTVETSSTAATTTTDTSASTTATTVDDLSIPTTSFSQAEASQPGAGQLPPGIPGSTCPDTYIDFNGQLTTEASDAAYAIATAGSSDPSCATAGKLALTYLNAPGIDPGNSQTAPGSVAVGNATCASYWYRPSGDMGAPIPYVTCVAPGSVVTFYGLES